MMMCYLRTRFQVTVVGGVRVTPLLLLIRADCASDLPREGVAATSPRLHGPMPGYCSPGKRVGQESAGNASELL